MSALKKTAGFGLVALLVGVIVILSLGYYRSSRALKTLQDHTPPSAAQEAKDLVAAIGAFMQLPDETPTIATVEDTAKLAGQQFFDQAQKGDKVLMYATTRKAILYRPSVNKIIEVAYLHINEQP